MLHAWAGGTGLGGGEERGDIQAEREELRDATEDHDHGDHEVDDTAATGGDMLARTQWQRP